MFYLTTHSTYFFNLLLYGVEHVVKDHSDRDRGNPLSPLHGLLFPISSKGYFYIHHPTDRIAWITGWMKYRSIDPA